MSQSSTLSHRAQAELELVNQGSLWEILQNQWDPEENPEGIVSLGVAENRLMHADLEEHINQHFHVPQHALTYGDGPVGSRRLRDAVARFLNRRIHPAVPLEREHIIVTNGLSDAVEHCSWSFCNRGEGFLLGQPHYTAFIPDIATRPEVEVVTVKFGEVDPVSLEGVKNYEAALLEATERGVTVRGLMLCNPHNPLGRCYPQEVIIELMKLCQKYQLHFVSDEIYAFSVWENKEDPFPPATSFVSALSIPVEGIIDPERVHVLWGMGKDFGANGIRLGFLISQHNAQFRRALQFVAVYSSTSSISEHVAANVLEDEAWTDNYIKTNQRKLSEAYSNAISFLREHGISYTPGAHAAFFLWVDLGKAYRERHANSTASNEELTQALFDNKVFIADGTGFGAENPGIFRIVFTHPKEYLAEGLRRMLKAIEQ